MEFCELPLPTPKKFSPNSNFKPFPIDDIPKSIDENSFRGVFNGLSVEIYDSTAIKHLYLNGCFGISAKTKNVPQDLYESRVKNITQSQFERKNNWNKQFTNQNQDIVVVNVLSSNSNSVAGSEEINKVEDNVNEIKEDESDDSKIDTSTDLDSASGLKVGLSNDPMEIDVKVDAIETITEKVPEQNLVEDPFSIEDALALLPEEAFFLHFSLRCLKVWNFNQTHEFTTEELLEQFCRADSKFVQKFIVYHFYRSKNWVVKSGLKFGGDFLLYYKGPRYYHASYVVLVNDNDDSMNQLDMQSNFRVSESTNKDVILATITRPDGLEYSNQHECIQRLKQFTITEIIPKRLTINQLLVASQKS